MMNGFGGGDAGGDDGLTGGGQQDGGNRTFIIFALSIYLSRGLSLG
jgi:hypothetical protein